MPLIRISLAAGKPADYRRTIAENVYEALRETFDVPANDFFATVTEHKREDFIYDRRYFGIERSDELAVIQLTVSNTRTVEQKKALYRRIVERLGRSPGLRPEDVFVNLVEVAKENWSFGNGQAQYALTSSTATPSASTRAAGRTIAGVLAAAVLVTAAFFALQPVVRAVPSDVLDGLTPPAVGGQGTT